MKNSMVGFGVKSEILQTATCIINIKTASFYPGVKSCNTKEDALHQLQKSWVLVWGYPLTVTWVSVALSENYSWSAR